MRLGLTLPAPRVSALLVLVFLGFGMLLGRATRAPLQDTLAASARPRLRIVLPPTAPAQAAGSSASAPAAAAASGEVPEAEAEATPTPSPSAATAPAKAPRSPSAPNRAAGSGSGEGGAGEGTSGEGASGGRSPAGAPATKLPPIEHVFEIVLSDQPYAAVFGPESSAHYLAHTLERRGELLVRYDAVAHEELANELALISGQGPTAETAGNCPTYADIAATGSGPLEQVLGSGCVYPTRTRTLAGQLAAKHLRWRAYIDGATEAPGAPGACAHPALGQPDPSSAQSASTGAYATFRNPFVYFHSIIDTPACAADDVGLGQLKPDLRSAARTPSLSYIVPDRCHDANPTPCTPGAPAGLAPADAFLARVVPEITASQAYKQGGLIVITVDEAPSGGAFADSSSCCGQPRFPNLPAPSTTFAAHGGGTVGALLLSPYVKGALTSQEPFNHFSLLRTIEDVFGLAHLGYAAAPAVKPFAPAMFTASRG